MEGRTDPYWPDCCQGAPRGPWRRRALALLPLLALGWPAWAAAEERSLPPPAVKRLPPRVIPGAVPAPRALPPGSVAAPGAPPGAPLPGLRPPVLPHDPHRLPPPAVRRLPGRVLESQAPRAPVPPPTERAVSGSPRPPDASARPVAPAAPSGPPTTAGAAGGLVSVPPRPPRPESRAAPEPQDLLFEVDEEGGVVRTYQEEGGVAVYVMVGNPRVFGQAHTRSDGQAVGALSIKANVIVAWIDQARLPELSLGGAAEAADDGSGRADAQGAGGTAAQGGLGSVFEEAVLGIYAEGAVEVIYGELAFRAEVLHLDPRTVRGLMVEPRFEGRFRGKDMPQRGLPVITRARRGRLLAAGLMVFDDAEVSTTKAEDRIELRVRSLTVEEFGEAAENPEAGGASTPFLGFQGVSTQRYRARQISLRGERLPLAWVPYASFGLGRDAFPVRIKRVDGGSRSNLGLYGFVGIGDSLGPEGDPWVDWVLDVGGYTERGPLLGLELTWDRPGRTRGRVQGWGVYFDQGVDRDGFDPDDDVRGRITAESRTQLAPDLIFDVEFNEFSDRHFNREFFERDSLTHKDRESYGRLLWRPGGLAASLTGRWHQRDFVTETVEAPEAALWLGSLPLVSPARRGGLSVDLTGVSRAGYLGRRFDEALAEVPYDALRLDTETRLEAGLDAGDLRLSGWVGGAATSYTERTDGGEDLLRSALLAGARANLQLHAAREASGTWFQLDGLRHVVDLDLLAEGRFLDPTDPEQAPYLDERELLEERTEVALRVRNRLQTRRPGVVRGGDQALAGGGLRDVIDLETSLRWYLENAAPYLEDSPWSLNWSLRAEPRNGAHLFVGSEGDVDGRDGLVAATASVGMRPEPNVDVAVAYRYLKDEASAPLLLFSWRWSERYAMRITESYNFRDQQNVFRLLLRRFSPDHVISFGIRVEDSDDIGFELDLRPAIGGLTGESASLFEGEVDLDPTRAFR